MAQLSRKIKLYVGSEVDFRNDVILQDDGQGAYIKEWNLDTAQPTQEQLDALETQADEYEQNLITSKENNKTSAKQKLQDLGLTVDEIKEAFGI
jgi:RPA family protein